MNYSFFIGIDISKKTLDFAIRDRGKSLFHQMKNLLHMAALSVVSGKGEMADYYHRKVEQGKNKILVLNTVRNKIIHRVFACIRDDRKYEKIYAIALV